MTVHRSVVKWFDAKRGYGFIEDPAGDQDIFVHFTSISTERRFKSLRTGQVVEFELQDGPRGPHAVEVVVTESPDEPVTSDEQAVMAESA
jgi:cold shock protein